MTAIYHITHIENLARMLTEGGIWCDNECKNRELSTIGIAHNHIKERRARKRVQLGKGGTLADYVPFYFAPRSPMLYAIYTGYVEGYNGTQQNIVHLTSSVEKVVQHLTVANPTPVRKLPPPRLTAPDDGVRNGNISHHRHYSWRRR
jgi:hypothetical protein